jgi:aspartate-semialdehyde dehydrogenase
VTVECKRAASRAEVEEAFCAMPGTIYESSTYRSPREISGKQEVFVGRLRTDRSDPAWLQFWVVGDNLRKGAASNAVQILMELFKS